MAQNQLKARRGPSIREFLRYYVLILLKGGDLTEQGLIGRIREESACNRDYRPAGQLRVHKGDLNRVLANLRQGGLIASARGKWRLTADGSHKIRLCESQKQEQSDSKERAARILLALMGRASGGERVLDVGTGEGYLAFKVAKEGYRVLGIDSASFDYSKDSLKTARRKAQTKGGHVEFLKSSVTDLRGRNKAFDYVVASQAIHCLEDQPACLQAIYRLLKPGGVLLCMDFRVGLKGFLQHGWHVFLAISEEEWKELLPRCGFGEPEFSKLDDYLIVMARKPEPTRKPGVRQKKRRGKNASGRPRVEYGPRPAVERACAARDASHKRSERHLGTCSKVSQCP